MKKICYAIFGSHTKTPQNSFEFYAYMRGLYWNVRMNKILYPDWITHVEVDVHTMSAYDHIFYGLNKEFGMTYNVNPVEPKCKAMLWRMKPLFEAGVEKILCRDADAITTYREAQAVNEWQQSGMKVHGIADNPYHACGLMGGMIGFDTQYIKERFGWQTWDSMMSLANENFDQHGADQNFLAKHVYPNVKNEMIAHYMCNVRPDGERIAKGHIENQAIPNVAEKYWESNLTCRHIGSAGVVDMELIRFFQRFDPEHEQTEFTDSVMKNYPEIFYWKMK